MLKKVLSVVLLMSIVFTSFNTVNAGLIDSIINQGIVFDNRVKNAGNEERKRQIEQLQKEYNEQKKKIEIEYDNNKKMVESNYNAILDTLNADLNKALEPIIEQYNKDIDKLNEELDMAKKALSPKELSIFEGSNNQGAHHITGFEIYEAYIAGIDKVKTKIIERTKQFEDDKNVYMEEYKISKDELDGNLEIAYEALDEQFNAKTSALDKNYQEQLNKIDKDNFGQILANFIEFEVKPAVNQIGNLIFAVVTVILGVKYIWSGAEGKAAVQETLPGFTLAVIFFYLAGPVTDFVLETTAGVTSANNWEQLSGNVIWIINTVVKYLALAGLIFMGIRYLLASAEGKASLKTNMGVVVLGILCVFLASNMVNFIIQTGEGIFNNF